MRDRYKLPLCQTVTAGWDAVVEAAGVGQKARSSQEMFMGKGSGKVMSRTAETSHAPPVSTSSSQYQGMPASA